MRKSQLLRDVPALSVMSEESNANPVITVIRRFWIFPLLWRLVRLRLLRILALERLRLALEILREETLLHQAAHPLALECLREETLLHQAAHPLALEYLRLALE